MKRIVIIGGNGMLGTDLHELAIASGYEVIIFDRPDFDITNKADVKRAVASGDVIVNCAAYTAVDKAESEPEAAYAVNAAAVKNLGEVCASANKYLVHISTDFVFGDDSDRPLKETDSPSPLSVYGRTKLEGEILLSQTPCRAGIIRVQWTYGKGGNNFIYKIVELAKSRPELKVVDDQVGAPTPTASAAAAILCFLEKQPEGIFHFAAKGYASRYETAIFIADKLGLDVKISPCASTEFPAPAARPLNSRFDCSKIDAVLDFPRPVWDEALERFLKN